MTHGIDRRRFAVGSAGLIAAAGDVIAAITLHMPRPQQQKENAEGADLATTGRSR